MSLINLLPEDYVARRAQRRVNLLCSILFGVVVIGVLAAAVVSERGYARTREVSERVNQSYAKAGRLIQQLQQLEATKHSLLAKAKLTAGLLERVPRSYLLAVVTQALPPGTSLTRFELESKRGITVSGGGQPKSRYEAVAAGRGEKQVTVSGPQVEITVTGFAATDVEVGRFIAAMARSPLMDTVDLVYSQEKIVNESVVREFQVVLRLNPGADVRGAGSRAEPSLTLADPDARGS